jgi:hypothetical protein
VPLSFDIEWFSEINILMGLILTAALIVLIADWRLALSALIAQYLLSAVLQTQVLLAPVAIVRVLSGALAAIILYLTLRRIEENEKKILTSSADAIDLHASRSHRREIFVVGFPFRLFALALVTTGIIGIASSMTFLGLSSYVLFSGMWLTTIGILVAILSRDVPRLGLGILMFTNGFCILQSFSDAGLFLYGLINVSDLLLAVVISHLAMVTQDDPVVVQEREEVK